MAKDETKNDQAWGLLFDRYDILKAINKTGFYEIEAKTINTVRESRLMAKFDHEVNLPKLFKQNRLSILPISRSKYVIGRFSAYCDVSYDNKVEPIAIDFPQEIESIDYTNLYSESSALLCAHTSGIVDDILGEQTRLTVSGRMSTGNFDFNISCNACNGNDNLYPISVNNSQCEIDAGFEGEHSFLLIEAKNFAVEDFLVRQLYYPYRLWQGKLSKPVVPVLMTYSNDMFSFFIYDFKDFSVYNSLRLVKQKNYIISPEDIDLKDILDILAWTNIEEEPKVPFPQADKFERVVDLLGLLMTRDLTKEEITENYQFDVRQTDYYTNAARYLGLMDKYKSKETGEIVCSLTVLGREIMSKRFKNKYLSLVELILKHEIFNRALRTYLDTARPLDKSTVSEIMRDCYMYNVGKDSSTPGRRASSVIGWVNWILDLTAGKREEDLKWRG